MTTAQSKTRAIEVAAPGKAATPIGDQCFMEVQFPVSKLSKESYRERSAKQGQLLTGLGKWWGRKPLVLVRATILGLLLPATDNPEKDREVFLRLMTMDDDGMLRRKNKSIPQKMLFERVPPGDREKYFKSESTEKRATYKRGVKKEVKDALQRSVFLSMSYDERLPYCARPEQIDGPSHESWKVINRHLDTSSTSSLCELVAELGRRRFGRVPWVGDSFCGGGSIPFEAAHVGANAFGSDLSPVAGLLSWASIHIVGGSDEIVQDVQRAQRDVFQGVDRQITEWAIEHREPDADTGRRWRADAYLYCIEAQCPECDWLVPLAPSWIIGRGTHTVCRLIPDNENERFSFEIISGVTAEEMRAAEESGTAKDSSLICPHCSSSTPIRTIRGDGLGSFGPSNSKLRAWTNRDLVPRPADVFGERLYCIRWVDRWMEVDDNGEEREQIDRVYLVPTEEDLEREERVLQLLRKRFDDWQDRGYIPKRQIKPGAKTTEPIRTRGWTHWHHLFTPRQLLVNGLFHEVADAMSMSKEQMAYMLLLFGRLADWNSRLCRWHNNAANEKSEQTFSNQALNTLANYAARPLWGLDTTWFAAINRGQVTGQSEVLVEDARLIERVCDLWITDPPYADAICYDELSEYFLAWYGDALEKLFVEWPSDSRRALAVRGSGASFTHSMVDCYQRLTQQMTDNGLQVVMFTHQDAGVWADLSLILWAAGLRVSAAWCIATETDSVLKKGNYVQGTVLLVLRKRVDAEEAFLSDLPLEIESEVRAQLDAMRSLDDRESPNFDDTDYQLAAYAAALRVLTSKQIEDIDVEYELTRTRAPGETSPVEALIEQAVKIACDHLVPRGIDSHLWKTLLATERFYLKGLEVESHGERRSGVFQELARGFGVEEYRTLMASTSANVSQLKTASELGRRDLGGDGFGNSLVRHALFAAFKTLEMDSTQDGLQWLKTELPDYPGNRRRLIDILNFLSSFAQNASMEHWHGDAQAAHLVAGALENDTV